MSRGLIRLRELREELGLSQSELKDTLNARLNRSYDRHTVSRWENGRQPIPQEVEEELLSLKNQEQRQTTVIAFANQKGGVGKTTSALYVASSLAKLNFRTLLIDVDPQSSATAIAIGPHISNLYQQGKTLPHALLKGAPLTECIVKKGWIGEGETALEIPVDFCPNHIDLSDLDARSEPGMMNFLKEAIASVKNDYDFIVLDLPPNRGPVTKMALAASNIVFIPVRPEAPDIMGVNLILGTITDVRRRYGNPRLRIGGILPTQFAGSHYSDVAIVQHLIRTMPEDVPVLKPVPSSTAISNAYWNSKSVETNLKNPAVKSYMQIAQALAGSSPYHKAQTLDDDK